MRVSRRLAASRGSGRGRQGGNGRQRPGSRKTGQIRETRRGGKDATTEAGRGEVAPRVRLVGTGPASYRRAGPARPNPASAASQPQGVPAQSLAPQNGRPAQGPKSALVPLALSCAGPALHSQADCLAQVVQEREIAAKSNSTNTRTESCSPAGPAGASHTAPLPSPGAGHWPVLATFN